MSVTLDIPSTHLVETANLNLAEPRIHLCAVSWEQYETLIATVGNRPRLRISYLEDALEIMTISPEHEMIKKMIARLLEIYAIEADISLYSTGSATFRQRAAGRGLEADESYCINDRKDIPDIAIEVVLTSGVIDKMKIYQGLGVLEVWVWQAGTIVVQQLREDQSGYSECLSSALIPALDFQLLAGHMLPQEEPQALRAFRTLIRKQINAE